MDDSSPAEPRLRVLLVDDDPQVRLVTSLSMRAGGRIEVIGDAGDGDDAVDLYRELRPDVVVMDVEMPRVNGWLATQRIVEFDPAARIVALTGHVESDSVTRMVVAGAVGYAVKGSDPELIIDTVVKAAASSGHVDPKVVPSLFASVLDLARTEQLRRQQAESLALELKSSYQDTVRALCTALKIRDASTDAHSDRVTDTVHEVGARLGLSDRQLADLEYGAIFHDIGKIGVPDSILHNTDELTDAEWDVIKQHTLVGEQIIRPIGFLRNVGRIVRHSHEHWDGSGYPDHLHGHEIPIESRIILACDAYDAMTSHRAYQEVLSPEQAVERMRELAGTHFDPEVVQALLEVLADLHAAAAL